MTCPAAQKDQVQALSWWLEEGYLGPPPGVAECAHSQMELHRMPRIQDSKKDVVLRKQYLKNVN